MLSQDGYYVVPMCPHVQDFATSSLHGEVVREEAIGPVQVAVGEGEDLEQYQIVERRSWGTEVDDSCNDVLMQL